MQPAGWLCALLLAALVAAVSAATPARVRTCPCRRRTCPCAPTDPSCGGRRPCQALVLLKRHAYGPQTCSKAVRPVGMPAHQTRALLPLAARHPRAGSGTGCHTTSSSSAAAASGNNRGSNNSSSGGSNTAASSRIGSRERQGRPPHCGRPVCLPRLAVEHHHCGAAASAED